MYRKSVQLGSRLLTLILLSISFLGFAQPAFAKVVAEGIQVYQKDLHLDAERKKKLNADITRYRNADNIWDILREEFSLSHYERNPLVQEKIDWYMNNQDFLLRSASRAAPYLYYILQQVKKQHLPAELVLIPVIESGYNPFAISSVGAVGLWQMMPNTATGLGVRRDIWYDGRRDIIASTRAALNYLAYLQSFFDGNWLLAIAAYNTGEGNVASAIKRNIRAGRGTDYWSLPLAQQTRDYVPSLLALATIISRPDQYPVYFPPVRNAPYLAQVETSKRVSLKMASSLAGISYKKLLSLNAGFNRPSKAAKYNYKLVLPIEHVEQFSENLAMHFPANKAIDWVHYRVKSGDTLSSISRKFETTTAALRKMNHLSASPKSLKQGATILIPDKINFLADNTRTSGKAKSVSIKSNPKKSITLASKAATATRRVFKDGNKKTYLVQPGDTVYMVKSKDTLSEIAKHFNVGAKDILAVNNLHKEIIHAGNQIVIPTGKAGKTPPAVMDVDDDMKPGDTIYMVRRGDTIEKIAHRFKTTETAIKLANFVDNKSLFEGEKIVVPTHVSG